MHNIREQANVEVITKQLYNEDATRTPTQYGVLDRRMVCDIRYILFHLIKKVQNIFKTIAFFHRE